MNPNGKSFSDLNFQDYNILIVDDTPINLKVIVEFLQSYGFGIRLTRSGENAIKRVQYDKPDIVLLDVLMPGIDGFETCRQLKENDATKDVPIIFMTSLTSIEDKIKGFEVGAVDYVTKPLHQEEVLARVKMHLCRRKLIQGLQAQNRQLKISSQIEKDRLFEAVTQQREQLRTLNTKLTDVQEAERKDLARELHDEMGQSLTAIRINLAAIRNELSRDCSPGIKERLIETELLTDQTLEQIREMSLNLRPPMLDDLGLVPTLRWYIKRYAKRVNITADLVVTGLDQNRVASQIETVLYRITQEALTNVAKHAQASIVRLYLQCNDNTVQAVIEDNGCGFNIEDVMNRRMPHSGTGLVGIRERITLLGGDFNIKTQPNRGTRLVIEIPLGHK